MMIDLKACLKSSSRREEALTLDRRGSRNPEHWSLLTSAATTISGVLAQALKPNRTRTAVAAFCVACFCAVSLFAQTAAPKFRAIAFYNGRSETAHLSFVKEANRFFPKMAAEHGFAYDSTDNWENLNPEFLAQYQVAIFLDTRPDAPAQREAFRKFIEDGGGWMGFHFAGFALTPSEFPQNWDWCHNDFLGAGSYAGNTWRPTSAILKVEDARHPAMKGLPETFKASPNE